MPREWAIVIRTVLATAYQARIRGDRADNLEKAIAIYEAALTVLTRGSLAERVERWYSTIWVQPTRTVSAAAVRTTWRKPLPPTKRRLRSERARACRASGRRRRTTWPSHIMSEFAASRANNLEMAIAGFGGSCSRSSPREALPTMWAKIQSNLADASRCCVSVVGEPIDLEEAIAATRRQVAGARAGRLTRHVGTRPNQPCQCLCRPRARRSKRQPGKRRLPPAREHCRCKRARPSRSEWANTQNNLGIAYLQRINGDRADNLEKAIAHLDRGVDGLTRARPSPASGRWYQHNLALVYSSRTVGEKADNMEKAIAAYEAALTVRTRESCYRTNGRRRRTISASSIWTASAMIGLTTWRRRLAASGRRLR